MPTPISPLTGNSTFYDWYLKTNDEIITRLNQISIFGATSGDGVKLETDINGILKGSIGGTSGNILSGLSFGGKVAFNGEVVVPNMSFKITGITSGTPGYTFGNIIRLDGTGYTLAKANSADNAEALGVLSALNSTYSVVTVSGRITGNFNTVAGGTLSSGCIYFIDPTNAGKITTTEPVTVGQVSKPMIMGVSDNVGLVVQYRGNYLSGSSTLGVSGNNRIFAILPNASGSCGFNPGVFLSYLPNVGSYGVSFNNYLQATGRTAFSGWFRSQATSTSVPSPMPFEEEFIVGMIETSKTFGTDRLYQIVTKGASEVIPASVTPGSYGWWIPRENGGASNQLIRSSNNILEDLAYERLYVGYNYNDTSFIVDIKPQIRRSTNQARIAISGSDGSVGAITNETFNGDFTIWQRPTGRSSEYAANVSKIYFADQWVRRTSRTSLVTQTLERKTFDKSQVLVEGSPQYYVDVKCIVDPSSMWLDGYHSIGHIINGIETLNNEDITVSFYAKCSQNNFSANVYMARYNGTTLVSKNIIGTITPTTTWGKYTINYTVPQLPSSTYQNDYVEIGFDIEPTVKEAFDNTISMGTNLYMSFASLCVYNGSYINPKHLFESSEIKKSKANKFYFTSYTQDQVQGTQTLSTNGEIAINSYSIQYIPTAPFKYEKFPVQMRTSPIISLYSPSTGAFGDAYNINAGLDLRQTSGTIGYEKKSRVAQLNTQTINAIGDSTGYKLNIVNGAVHYDIINYHIIADASYPL